MGAVVGVVVFLLLLAIITAITERDRPDGCGYPGCEPDDDVEVVIHIHGRDTEGVATVARWLRKRIADNQFDQIVTESYFGGDR